MNRRPRLPLFLLLLSTLFGAGCATRTQEVRITTVPPGAAIYVNGDYRGVAPLQLDLPTDRSHQVRAEKPAFQPVVHTIAPTPNDRAGDLVRFGLLDDAGHYQDLRPNPLEIELRGELVPHRRGLDPFAELTQRVIQLDGMLDAGRITSAEHALIQQQLLAVFH